MTVLFIGPEFLVGRLSALCGRCRVVRIATAEELKDQIVHADAIVDASMRIPIGRDAIGTAGRLRIVATATTGANHIDHEALADRRIRLTTLKDAPEVLAGFTGAAEHSWLLLLACARQLAAARAAVLDGEWNRERFPGILLRGKSVGIVGCGRIGQAVARYAQAFEMEARGFDPHATAWPSHIHRHRSLQELLAASDFVSVHVPLNDETRHLIDRSAFGATKRGVVIVNTSRGEVIDEEALLTALESGAVAAAGLDVLSGEPDVKDHSLRLYALTHSNLLITPHIGGYCPETVVTATEWAFRQACAHLDLPA